MTTVDNVTILFTAAADEMVIGDQIIIDGELVIIRAIDSDREDIDEIRFKVENLTAPDSDIFDVYADDSFQVWAI